MSHTHENVTTPPSSESKISLQMRAVLNVITGEPKLMDTVGPFVDFTNDTVQWDQIFSAPLTDGQRAACHWAFALWAGDVREPLNIFETALLMEPPLRLAVLRALRLRWGLQK